MEPRHRFALRLRTTMQNRKVTARNLARSIDADRTTVLNWMAGRKLPNPQYYQPLCKELRVRPATLILD